MRCEADRWALRLKYGAERIFLEMELEVVLRRTQAWKESNEDP